MATPDPRLVSAFDECIARLVRGEPLDSVLERFPDLASALRPMLEAGALVRRARPDPREVVAAQERVRFYVQRQLRKPARSLFAPRALMGVAALVLIVFVGMLFLSERSLPGDTLYGLKRASENVRTALSGQDFSERRIDETLALMAAGRAAEVVFQGHVGAISDSLWAVEGVPLLVDSATVLTPGIAVGDRVKVRARVTSQGQALALAISLLDKSALPTATPTLPAMPTATIAPTGTPTATATASPSPTWTASPTLTATSTPTPTLTPTRTPSRTPSRTATRLPPPVTPPTNALPPSGNDNGNDNDGDDHSGSGDSGGSNRGSGGGNDNGGD